MVTRPKQTHWQPSLDALEEQRVNRLERIVAFANGAATFDQLLELIEYVLGASLSVEPYDHHLRRWTVNGLTKRPSANSFWPDLLRLATAENGRSNRRR